MKAIDLFAGAGGFTTAAVMAGCVVEWAANHSRLAVEVHKSNHRHVIHSCQDLQQADWSLVPDHDLLLASPCCHGHSRARGLDRPEHEKSRCTAWAVVSCAEYKRPPYILCENVPEQLNWGLFPSWCDAMRRLGYSLSTYILDAADHGVPQHRKRLFIVGSRSRHPIQLKFSKRPHIPVERIIRWDDFKWSPIKKSGRSKKTLARIANGRKVFKNRFLIPYYSSGSGLTGRSLQRPIGTITTKARWAIVDGERMRMLQVPEARDAMGFPTDYWLPPKIEDAMMLLGNAVPPPLARDVIKAIQRAA